MINKKNILRSVLSPFVSRAGSDEISGSKRNRQYFFNEFYVAGYPYYDGESIEDRLLTGKEVIFRREPDSPYDAKAVEVYSGGKKLGYITKKDNRIIADLLDLGISVKGEIRKRNFDDRPSKRVKISVYKEI